MSKATHVNRPYAPLTDDLNGVPYNKYANLPSILRDCALYVERNEFHPMLYQALSLLHQYAGENAGKKSAMASHSSEVLSTPVSNTVDEAEADMDSFPIPEDRSGSPTPTTTSTNSGGNSKSRETVKKFTQFGKNIGSAFKGTEKVLGEALSKIHVTHKPGSSSSYVEDDTGVNRLDEHSNIIGGYKSQEVHSEKQGMTESQPRPQSSLPSVHPDSNAPLPNAASGAPSTSLNTSVALTSSKPCFQRPINPKSNLIANGWIEQQRRSKMRVIWKDILASLVEGRKPKEETTLWIQRQVTNPATGKLELEALHQIPMKWIEDVTYVNMYGDHRFAIKIFNVLEEFQFRTRDADSAHNWVVTLLSAVEASNKGIMMSNVTPPPLAGLENPNLSNVDHTTSCLPSDGPVSRGEEPKVHTIKELRAIAEKAGIDTRGMERSELELIAARFKQTSKSSEQERTTGPSNRFESNRFQTSEFTGAARAFTEEEQRRRQVDEQERRRRQLEEEERKRQLAEEEYRRRQLEEQERKRQLAEEEFRRRQLEEQERKRQLAEEEYRRRQLEEQERKRQLAEEEFRRRQQEEQERKRQLAEEEFRRRQQEEQERKRQLAEEEFRRRQQEEQERKQQLEEQERKRRLAEEEYRRRMAWQQQQNIFQQQQQQANGSAAAAPPQQGPSQQGSLKDKYAHIMEQRSEEDEQVAITAIKRNILVHWALLPPRYNTLRPIDHLVVSIQTCFPPAFGVKEHEFFLKWKPILPNELVLSAAMGNSPNAEKLKKAVRKIRFFLHPDKRPKDLNPEQEFMCKMLWDITSDAWDEFCSKHEELDWLRT